MARFRANSISSPDDLNNSMYLKKINLLLHFIYWVLLVKREWKLTKVSESHEREYMLQSRFSSVTTHGPDSENDSHIHCVVLFLNLNVL